MTRCISLTALLLTPALALFAAEKPTAEEAARIKKAEAAAIADPNDEVKLEELRRALYWYNSHDEEADEETFVAGLQATIDSMSRLKPTEAKAVKQVEYGINYCRVTIANYKLSLSDLEEVLDINPDDHNAMTAFSWRSRKYLEKYAQTDLAKATAVLDALKARIVKVTENCSTESMKKYMEAHASFMPGIESRFIAARKQGVLLNNEAPELEMEKWVQGEPVKLADLKGKVVLIDFWAVWCGPCISTFPKLRDWQKRFSDKGLVTLGVSRSCNFSFDETTGKATLKEDEESPPNEAELFQKFARYHKVTYPLVIEKQGSRQNEAYGRAAIPQVVLIGRDGKIKLIKVGGDEKTAKEIESTLEKLIKE
jgi:peroxiredoxin